MPDPSSTPRPTRTGRAVAVARAGLVRPTSAEGDPGAQRALCRGMPAVPLGRLAPHLAARTRYIDGRVTAALEDGVEQVVIVGAGYDDRSLRFRTAGVRFFELDHPATQADKRRRLADLGYGPSTVTLVEADFSRDDVDRALASAGHRPDRRSLFVCEGLLVYLDAADIVTLLQALRARGEAGTLVATLAVHRPDLPTAAVVARANAARGPNDEPWRTILPPRDHLDLVGRAGWRPLEVLDDAAVEPGAPPGRSLLVSAVPVAR